MESLLQDTSGELLIVPSVDHPIRVHVYGSVHNPPVVLLHGLYQSARCWKKQIPVLSQDYRLIVPDLPGHGGSPGGFSADLSPQSLGDILYTLLDVYVEAERSAVLVAWSWAGVFLRALLLSNYGKNMVKGMVLIGTSLDMLPWFADPEVQHAMTAFQDMLFSADEATRIKAFFRYHGQLTSSALAIDDYYETLGYNALSYLRQSIVPEVMLPLDDPQDRLYQSLPPTLIIQGREDQVCPVKIGRSEHQRIAGSSYLEYPCGHSPFLECPERFNTDVHRWIQTLP